MVFRAAESGERVEEKLSPKKAAIAYLFTNIKLKQMQFSKKS